MQPSLLGKIYRFDVYQKEDMLVQVWVYLKYRFSFAPFDAGLDFFGHLLMELERK